MNEHIRQELTQIPIPCELHSRCVIGMDKAETYRKGQIIMLKSHKKIVAAVAALVLTVSILGRGAVFADSIRGFFSDVTRFDGAVVGTEYHNATEEIAVTASADDHSIIVNAQFLYPKDAPYAFISEISLEKITLTDGSGSILMQFEKSSATSISNGEAQVSIPLDGRTLDANEEYILYFDTVVGHAKAEQPLPMDGNWSCTISPS